VRPGPWLFIYRRNVLSVVVCRRHMVCRRWFRLKAKLHTVGLQLNFVTCFSPPNERFGLSSALNEPADDLLRDERLLSTVLSLARDETFWFHHRVDPYELPRDEKVLSPITLSRQTYRPWVVSADSAGIWATFGANALFSPDDFLICWLVGLGLSIASGLLAGCHNRCFHAVKDFFSPVRRCYIF